MRTLWQMLLAAALLIAGILPTPIFAETLGNYGNVYDIAEPDGIASLQAEAARQLQGDKKDRLIAGAKRRYLDQLENLKPIAGIGLVGENSERYIDPTVIVSKNIYGPKGDLIASKGQRINPLETSPLHKRLIFIDARDQRQIEIAKKLRNGPDKVILVAGNLIDASNQLRAQAYYDLAGIYVERLQIRAVPSLVTQVGNRLLIKEISP